MEGNGSIDEVIERLTALASQEVQAPAVVIMPPDQSAFIHGNRGGFLRLAALALRAAKGEEQKFKSYEWVTQAELDWWVTGFKPDPEAHTWLPQKRSHFRRLCGEVFGGLMLLAFFGVLLAGLWTLINGVWTLAFGHALLHL